jgi:EmrB/QacA subfamily drug resistance transporter
MTAALDQHGAVQSLTAYPRRWLALAIIAVAQLMVVLDATIVNVALPVAQADLGISDANRQWVVTAYTLTFGGLLLLGGRIADYWGRKRAFILGIVGFAAASAVGGLAQDGEVLFAARALQGSFGALLAPASLALLSVLFVDEKERARAFGVYGAIAGGGSAIGLLLGGVLTEYADWRWCLLVNIPIALLAWLAAVPLVPESRAHGNTRYDVPGAVLVTLGLVSLVYGLTQAADPDKGWDSPETLGFLAAAALLLALFLVVERRSSHPLLPLRVLLDRTRGGAYLASTLIGAGFIGSILFLTFYFQGILGYTPVEAGLAALPLTAGILVAAGTASNLLPRLGARPLMVVGGLVAAGGLLWLTQITVVDQFWTQVAPAQVILGLGLGLMFVPLGNLALVGVGEHDAGAASAVLNASQQVGGSIGTALLNTLAVSATTAYITDHLAAHRPADPLLQARATVDGFVTAFAWGAVLVLASALVSLLVIKASRRDLASTPNAGAAHM